MLGAIRQFAERVKRRERIALLLVGVCSGIGLATACTGGNAFLEQKFSTFHRPDSSESRCVDQIAVVSSLEAPALVQPPPPPLAAPLVAAPALAARPAPGPLGWLFDAAPVSLRGPPTAAASQSVVVVVVDSCEGDVACRHMMRGFSGSS
jgi:hypothetical protein